MRNRLPANTFAFVVRCVVIGLAAAFVLSMFAPRWVERLRGAPASVAAGSPHAPFSYAEAVARASPAVVNIYANKITTFRRIYPVPDPLTQRLLGIVPGPIMKRQDQSLGSGVIFSPDG